MAIKDFFSKNLDFNSSKKSMDSLFSTKKYSFYFLGFLIIIMVSALISNQMFSYNKQKEEGFKSFVNTSDFTSISKVFLNKLRSPYKEYKYTIKNNDSVEKILKNFSIKSSEIKSITQELNKKKLSNIYIGREVTIVLKENQNDEKNLINIFYPVSNTLNVEIRKTDKDFLIRKNVIKLSKKEVVVKNSIKNNLYTAAVDAGIEPNIIIEFARIYGFEVDFQRDIRKEDWFEIYYEKFLDDNGVVKDTGKIIYASMYVNNKEINLYNFKHQKETGYFDLNGRSIVKALMKTPINGARLSSGFGNRKHPILGFTKHHNGTDFAAPTGTPIMASGSGTVITAGWCGNGGNCVRIRHNSSYTTGYGHLSKFATKVGRKVRQGQVIGYVGNTGMSTGPHLHYTVKYNGKFINSQKLKLPSGKRLNKEARKDFEIQRIKIDLKLADLRKQK